MLEMWNYANDNGLVYDSKAAEDNTNYTNPIVEALKYNIVNKDQNYSFATSYGFHAVAVEKLMTLLINLPKMKSNYMKHQLNLPKLNLV